MLVRISFIVALSIMLSGNIKAQVYDSDSLKIEIKYTDNFLVKEYKDLNIDIVYLCKSEKKRVLTYKSLESSYRSPLGNCYFELQKYDSASSSYKDITFEVMGIVDRIKDFKDEAEILKNDIEKFPLKYGAKRTLTFNLLNFTPLLLKGKYSMKFYLRIGDKFGHDEKGDIITNSLIYVESKIMNFEVLEEIHTPNRL